MKGFTLVQNKKQGVYIYDSDKRLYHVLIPALYDYVAGVSYVQRASFNRSFTYNFKYENGKYIFYVYKDGKKGFIDLMGREFFRN